MRAVSASNEDALLDELKAAAFEVLLLNPGSECADWQKILVEQYGDEVIDAFGTDPAQIYASLTDLWETPYLDERSGLEHTYAQWAEALQNEAAVQMYYDLTPRSG